MQILRAGLNLISVFLVEIWLCGIDCLSMEWCEGLKATFMPEKHANLPQEGL